MHPAGQLTLQGNSWFHAFPIGACYPSYPDAMYVATHGMRIGALDLDW